MKECRNESRLVGLILYVAYKLLMRGLSCLSCGEPDVKRLVASRPTAVTLHIRRGCTSGQVVDVAVATR